MKRMMLVSLVTIAVAILLAINLMGRQSPPAGTAAPCPDAGAVAELKPEPIQHDPLLDPIDEMRTRAQKKMDEKNFKELQDSAAELSTISARMSREINTGGQYVISLNVLNDLDKIEKLTKKVRARAK